MSGSLDALNARIERLIEKRAAKLEPFRATVKAVGTGLVTIRRPEASADDDEEYARVAGFTLQVGDEVLCLPTSGKPTVIGRLQRTAISDLDLSIRNLTITGTQTGGSAGITGPTGPAGAASTVTGPTGPVGAASTVTGPTGPTGPTGVFSALASNGLVAQTATTPTFAARTITGTTNQITVTNGSGASANPTIAISRDPSVTGNIVTTYDATTPRPVVRVNADNALVSGSLGGFQLYRGASLAAEFKVDAGGTVDFRSYSAAGSFPDFRIFAHTLVKLLPQNEAAGEAYRFDVDTSSTGTYGYTIFTEAKSGNANGATWKHFGGSGLAIDADTGFLKLGASSAVPVTISQSGQTTTIGGELDVAGKLLQQGAEPVTFIDGQLAATISATAATLTQRITSGSYAMTAPSVVRAKMWGHFGATTASGQTFTITLRQGTTSLLSMVIVNAASGSNTNVAANAFYFDAEVDILTTTTATAVARVHYVNNQDANGATTSDRVKVLGSTAISSSAATWNIATQWSTTTGTPTATILGGYIELAIN